jgi:hypothetical protein
MTARKSGFGSKPGVDQLELNRETVQELSDSEAEAAAGGVAVPRTGNRFQTPCRPTASDRACTLGPKRPTQMNCPLPGGKLE